MCIKNRFNVFYTLLYECKLKIIQMEKELKKEEMGFQKWLEQFIISSCSRAGLGFFINTIDGEFKIGTPELKSWYDSKLKEYKQTHNF